MRPVQILTGSTYKCYYSGKDLLLVCLLAESTGFYLKWVHVCFQTLINLLQTEGASFANPEEADRMQVCVILSTTDLFMFNLCRQKIHLPHQKWSPVIILCNTNSNSCTVLLPVTNYEPTVLYITFCNLFLCLFRHCCEHALLLCN